MPDPSDLTYHWLARDGSKRVGSEAELRAGLSSGALSASSWVWRTTWTEWMPANRVRALSEAIPEAQRATPRDPKTDPKADHPPVDPVATKLPALGSPLAPGASARTSPPSSPAASSPPRDTLAPSSFGVIVPSRRPAEPARSLTNHASARARSPLPTLSDDEGVVSATATLRPPGAVPPPARGVPVPALDSSPRAALTPIPAFGPPGGKLDTVPPSALPAVVNKSLLADPESGTIAAQERPNERQHDARSGRDSLLKIGRLDVDSRTLLMALSALSGALLVAVVALLIAHSSSTEKALPRPNESVARAPGPVPTPVAAMGCRLLVPAARIAPSIERGVPPYATSIADERALAVGIAATKTKGMGLRLDPATLDVVSTFEEDGKEAVRGVVPLTRSGPLNYFVDRDDRTLRSAHTVDAIPPFTLGVNEAGFSRVVAGNTSLIWQLPSGVAITEPRSAELRGVGYGIAFRRGGQAGSVVFGFTASDGAKKSELVEIPGTPKLVGTPVIAAGNAAVLIAFAGRDTTDAAWKVFVSSTKPGSSPSAARALISAGGSGAISPSVAALPSGAWLVQWTEGSSGQYRVHAQSFTSELTPIGQPVLVSPKGANAGQGSLALVASSATALFILTTAGHDELWGATLSCQ